MANATVTIDHSPVEYEGERNLLELCRKTGVELPTFCYHSELSTYGACRMCLVEVEGRGVLPACSTQPTDGMVVHTNTKTIRDMRKMIVELMLASHDQSCTTCPKSGDCRLQKVAKELGVTNVRFKDMHREDALDNSSDAILRDPSKCILCGDCVRVCSEVQSVGALDFAHRGAKAAVGAGFNKGIGQSHCVGCGQCVKVCPVGALTPKYQISSVWQAIHDPKKTVVVQIAPAVRVAVGEYFGVDPGQIEIGHMVTALRRMGFNKVYDTCYGADFTVVEEGKEFLARYTKGEKMPLFTSCCPAWVKFAEHNYPELLGNLSTCKSPQQMFGALCKDQLTTELGVAREDLIVVSVMPCTAKKYEANRDEFKTEGNPDVDFVITTQELALMIKENGIDLTHLQPGEFDLPFGYFTGAAVIFGASGGVSEAVLRFAAGQLVPNAPLEFKQFRGANGLKTGEITIGDVTLRLAVVSGLANARKLVEEMQAGKAQYDIVEVMACCGGCVNGGGQPITIDKTAVPRRAEGLYQNDLQLELHDSAQNPYLQSLYGTSLDDKKAHHLLHTGYKDRSAGAN